MTFLRLNTIQMPQDDQDILDDQDGYDYQDNNNK